MCMSFVSINQIGVAENPGKQRNEIYCAGSAHGLRFDCRKMKMVIAMAKFELTKSIEARKLNPRTMVPLNEYHTIPFGAIIDNLVENRDMQQFSYLTDHYQYPSEDLKAASKPIQSVA